MLCLLYFCLKLRLPMSLTTLKDDLLAEFRDERVMITEQLELLDPLATSLRQPAARRLLSSGTLFITEFSCYVISLGGLSVTALLHRIYPFSILNKMFYTPDVRNKIGAPNLTLLIAAVYALLIIGVVFLFIIGRMAREIRLKNDILHHAGKDIKTIVAQHLVRKAAINTIEQRHYMGQSGVSPITEAKITTPQVVTVG